MSRNGLRLLLSSSLVLSLLGCGASSEDASGARKFFPGAAPPTSTGAAAGGGSGPGETIGIGGLSQPGLAGSGAVATPGAGSANKPGQVCASAVVRTAKAMPTIVFVVDGSGSMCAPFGGAGTRWQALRTALLDPMRGLVYKLQNLVSFGISLYDGTIDTVLALLGGVGGGPGGPGGANPQCALAYTATKAEGMCPQLVDLLPPKLNNAMAIDMTFPQTELGGSTPTDKAMAHVMDTLIPTITQQGPDTKAMGPVYVILATDGAPNDICVGGVGGDGSLQRQGVIAAVDRGAAAGITTWVISLADGDPALQSHLDEVARHGEPMNPMAHTFTPADPDALINTLSALVGGAVGCHINLNGRVTVGLECSGTVTLGNNKLPCCQTTMSGQVQCDGVPAATPSGWRLNDESNIELIGQACTEFLVGVDQMVDAQFPCDVFIPQ
jgi:Mg-chelatase subunit ChlD